MAEVYRVEILISKLGSTGDLAGLFFGSEGRKPGCLPAGLDISAGCASATART